MDVSYVGGCHIVRLEPGEHPSYSQLRRAIRACGGEPRRTLHGRLVVWLSAEGNPSRAVSYAEGALRSVLKARRRAWLRKLFSAPFLRSLR